MPKKDHVVVDYSEDGNFKTGKKKPKPQRVWILLLLFVGAIGILYLIFSNIPTIDPSHKEQIRIPTSLHDVQNLGAILSIYTVSNYYTVISAFSAVYIFLQAFSIPGSVFLSFLAGALFGVAVGVPLVCATSTIGATCSYLLSYYVAKNLVKRFFPDKLALFSRELAKHRSHILNYILFLRITPFLPNWFINLAAPILGVAVAPFMIATFFGVMPATYPHSILFIFIYFLFYLFFILFILFIYLFF
eukprot:Phypoly_transcript_05353.p1 GENE.Phypoly_transcript_05353~~Phypoly_transcript_05353.p1  ORF type:complete len:246 (-),score=28.34 Phypoly_transcript_05353:543-1280(-)